MVGGVRRVMWVASSWLGVAGRGVAGWSDTLHGREGPQGARTWGMDYGVDTVTGQRHGGGAAAAERSPAVDAGGGFRTDIQAFGPLLFWPLFSTIFGLGG